MVAIPAPPYSNLLIKDKQDLIIIRLENYNIGAKPELWKLNLHFFHPSQEKLLI